jgi:lipoyl(octanoyl) transferase
MLGRMATDSFLSSFLSDVTIIDFGKQPYETVYAEQKRLLEERIAEAISDTILIGEHLPVITLGRAKTAAENILKTTEIPVIETERGGDVTYHGPGQLVAYPIIKLREGQRDLHHYVRQLEQAIINTLAQYHIVGQRQEGATGVWVIDKNSGKRLKIASIGIAVKHWVTYHGLALNVSTDLHAFDTINPCGFPAKTMTSMQVLTGQTLLLKTVKESLIASLNTSFAYNN